MRLTRWQSYNPVFDQLQQFHSEMQRVFHRYLGDDGEGAGYAPAFPAVNVWEDAEAVHLEAELPGMDLKNLEIYVSGRNQLTLKGQRQPKLPDKAVWHRQERRFGTFTRVLTLPMPVDADHVEAQLENGVLHVQLAKHEAAKPRKIAVK